MEHALLECPVAKDLWRRVLRWWNMGGFSFSNMEQLFKGSKPNDQTNSISSLWQAVTWVTGYSIWRNRNLALFQKKKGSGPTMLNEVQIKSFEWISRRSKKLKFEWIQWLVNPSFVEDHG
ncbi:uncharacterized protein [Rutidosis leptorrhynchoides]|uniref:uncharacterized protein n=1 Tax=Rutidosis leptorrhynchoides TaxID=125765 RepID=UPI003A99F863